MTSQLLVQASGGLVVPVLSWGKVVGGASWMGTEEGQMSHV